MKSVLGLLFIGCLLQFSKVSSLKIETIELTSLEGNLTLSCFMKSEQVESVLHWITPNMDIVKAGDSSCTFKVRNSNFAGQCPHIEQNFLL